jgi:hypothetical protein
MISRRGAKAQRKQRLVFSDRNQSSFRRFELCASAPLREIKTSYNFTARTRPMSTNNTVVASGPSNPAVTRIGV